MRLPFFQSNQEDGPVRVPLPETLTCGYAVFFALRGRPLPEAPQVKAALNAWLETYAHGPIRSDIRALVARGLLNCRSGERSIAPDPPLELLAAIGMGEAEEQRLREATHVVAISAPDRIAHPRVGFWTALAAARRVA